MAAPYRAHYRNQARDACRTESKEKSAELREVRKQYQDAITALRQLSSDKATSDERREALERVTELEKKLDELIGRDCAK